MEGLCRDPEAGLGPLCGDTAERRAALQSGLRTGPELLSGPESSGQGEGVWSAHGVRRLGHSSRGKNQSGWWP